MVLDSDSYPVVISMFCGVRRLDKRMDLDAQGVMGRA